MPVSVAAHRLAVESATIVLAVGGLAKAWTDDPETSDASTAQVASAVVRFGISRRRVLTALQILETAGVVTCRKKEVSRFIHGRPQSVVASFWRLSNTHDALTVLAYQRAN